MAPPKSSVASDDGDDKRIERTARLEWFALGQLYPSPVAQRHRLNQARVDHLCASMDLEQLGYPVVNARDERVFILDGWHRIEALRQFGFTPTDKIECWTYHGLSEADEAERFLKLNDILPVDALSHFRVALNANRVAETEINGVLIGLDMSVSKERIEGAISAVGTLKRVYQRSGTVVLGRSLKIIADAYGTPGLQSAVIDGISMVCARYNGTLDDSLLAEKLAKTMGGVNGLLGRAQAQRKITHKPSGQCVAAAAVDILNAGRGGRKLEPFWKPTDR